MARRLRRTVEGPARPYVRRRLGVAGSLAVSRRPGPLGLVRALRARPDESRRRRRTPRRRGLLSRLRANLTKPRQAISPQLAGIFAPRLVTRETWDDLEEALIAADCGADVTTDLVEHLRAEAAQGRVTSGASLAGALWREVAREMGAEPPRIPLGH